MHVRAIDQRSLDSAAEHFYRIALQTLNEAKIPYLVGGAYGFERYTGIVRHTKDLDIFVKYGDSEKVFSLFSRLGYRTEIAFPHWLGKVHGAGSFVDVIFNSANGSIPVDDEWMENGVSENVLGVPTLVCAPEETIWSKSFVMSRDRYDGADLAHLFLLCADKLNWPRLIRCFGENWRVLLSHLTLFGFIYPGERDKIPVWVMQELLQKLSSEVNSPAPQSRTCRGTLFSGLQYAVDVENWGFEDARLHPQGSMSAAEISLWTGHLQKNTNA